MKSDKRKKPGKTKKQTKTKRRKPGQPRKVYPEDMIRDVMRAFGETDSAAKSAIKQNREWRQRKEPYHIREDEILKIVRKAAADGRFVVALQPDEHFAAMVAEEFDLRPSMIDVEMSNRSLPQVMRRAAGVAMDKIKRADKEVVHIGFGAGRSTMLVARYLGRLMSLEPVLPKIVCHALTKGFHIHNVAHDPMSFFSYLEQTNHDVEFVGLPVAPLISVGEESDPSVLDDEVLGDPFKVKWDIDIIVTSLANASDPNSEHRRLLEGCRMQSEAKRKGVVGDVLYCPYSATGRVEFESGKRVATLFDLDELCKFAAQGEKSVILVAGPCGNFDDDEQEHTRHLALRPLLEQDNLRCWTHLVTDRETCVALLRTRSEGAAA